MNLIGNICWLLFGGLIVCLEYLLASLLLCITIIGIPFGMQTFKLAGLALSPFGKQVVMKERGGTVGVLSIIFNIVWILLGGIWIAISHLFFALLCAISIIGIPFALQHFKLASLALTPFGYTYQKN